MIVIRQLDKDLITIGCIATLYKEAGKKIGDVIPDFNGQELHDLALKQDIYKSDEATEKAIEELFKECHQRVKKKITQNKK